jgi:syntaxin-binding protein 5
LDDLPLRVLRAFPVGGPDRPPSKRMIEQMRSEEQQRREAQRSGGGKAAADEPDEGYWAYMQRQIQERTERLNFVGDTMDRLEERSSGWADDVGKFVSNQKKKAMMGCMERPVILK